jgi:hypothetical protein
MASSQHKHDTEATQRRWTTPRVVHRGAVTEIIRSGGGKASLPVDGDGRKPGGMG